MRLPLWPIDFAHAALAQQRYDLVMPDSVANGKQHLTNDATNSSRIGKRIGMDRMAHPEVIQSSHDGINRH